MSEQVISPSECALLTTAPRTFEAFQADSRNDRKDYAKGVIGLSDTAFVWDRIYHPRVVLDVDRISNNLQLYRVHVVHHATLADFASALRRYPAVALVTHSRLSELEEGDVRDPGRCLALLRAPQIGQARTIAEVLTRRFPDLIEIGPGDPSTPNRIAEALNALIRPTHEFFQRSPGGLVSGHGLELALTRFTLELEFPECFSAAPCVEFFDGLATLPELIEVIPSDFSGVLDLSICNSAWLGDGLKNAVRRRAAPGQKSSTLFPGIVIGNAFPADMIIRLARFGLIIKVLSQEPTRYSDAAAKAHRFMIQSGKS